MNAPVIIGTAGHVDHGKTALIKSLTGIDTDRLPEEKARGLTIDLGYARLTLPDGRLAGIVDVPGHHRYLKNMLAGAGGIDVALLVVDAREGVRPQTAEHLAILDLLGLSAGVVAITKVDVASIEQVGATREQLGRLLAGTGLAGAPIVDVSALTGAGLPALSAALSSAASACTPRDPTAPVRLPIDRAFVLEGIGPVVTGSLAAGVIQAGDRLELLPERLPVRVRQLHCYGAAVAAAGPGERVALNLSGVDRAALRRGQVVASPDSPWVTSRCDARVQVLRDQRRGLASGDRVRAYLGTAEILGAVRVHSGGLIPPGETGMVELRLEDPGVVVRGDRVILRSLTADHTIGGGVVVEAHPPVRRHRAPVEETPVAPEDDSLIEPLDRLILTALERAPGGLLDRRAVVEHTQGAPGPVAEALARLASGGRVAALGREGPYGSAAVVWNAGERMLEGLLAAAGREPWRAGWRKDEVVRPAGSGVAPRVADAALERLRAAGSVRREGEGWAPAGHHPALPPDVVPLCDHAERLVAAGGSAPPAWPDVMARIGATPTQAGILEAYLSGAGRLVPVSPALWYPAETLARLRDRIAAFARREGRITPAQARDVLGITRKHAIPLLEYWDATGLTRRVGAFRVLIGD